MTEKKDELQAIFEDMKLDETVFTPEVMDKIKLVIESKVNVKLEEEKQALEEANKADLVEFKEGLVTQLDEYMTYFVEEFTKENKQDIIDSVKVKTAEKVLENFNKIVNDFNISLDEGTIDQSEKIQALEAELNNTVNESIKLKTELAEANKAAMITDKTMQIEVESERSKFSKLAETFDYVDEESFSDKLETLRESLEITIAKKEGEEQQLDEKELANDVKTLTEQTEVTSSKKKYLNVLNRTA